MFLRKSNTSLIKDMFASCYKYIDDLSLPEMSLNVMITRGGLAILTFGQCPVICSDKQHINDHCADLISDSRLGQF